MATAALLGLAGFVLLAGLEAWPRDAAEVAAVFPPWVGREGAFARALATGGEVTREGARGWILVVQDDAPGLTHRLYRAGAWLVIDPAVLGGCLAGRNG